MSESEKLTARDVLDVVEEALRPLKADNWLLRGAVTYSDESYDDGESVMLIELQGGEYDGKKIELTARLLP